MLPDACGGTALLGAAVRMPRLAVVGLLALLPAAGEPLAEEALPGPMVRSAAAEMLARPPKAFLPIPLGQPYVVPQQEGPGVVVSKASFDEAGLEPADPGAPLTHVQERGPLPARARGQGAPLTLSHYAFGAFQRGLYETAFTVALRAAAADDAAAAALIGRLYEEALGVEQDLEKAAGWYAVAAELGDGAAHTKLADMLREGRGVPASADKAADAYQAAAAKGSAAAARQLAVMLLSGEGRERRPSEGLRYMRQAAEAGDVEAQYALAVMYEDGQGTVPDDDEATRWYGRAARAGDEAASLAYALHLLDGIGTTADATTAARHFAIAARAGHPVAMNRYAHLLANGRGVEANPVEAIKWHLLARAAGVSDLFLDGFTGTADTAALREAERRAAAFVPQRRQDEGRLATLQ